jgi:hypothetical protein
MGATSGTGTAYPSGAPEFTPGISGVRVTRSLVLYICFADRCLSLIFTPYAGAAGMLLHINGKFTNIAAVM